MMLPCSDPEVGQGPVHMIRHVNAAQVPGKMIDHDDPAGG